MRIFGGFGLALLLSASAFGQGYHSFFNPQPTLQGGFGNVVYPGGTSAINPAIQRSFGNVVYPGGGGPRLNVPLSSQGPTPLLPSFGVANLGPSVGQRRSSSRRSTGVYAVPVYVGGGYGGYYGNSYGNYYDNSYPADAATGAPAPQQPNVIVVYPQAPPPAAFAAPQQQPYDEPAAAAVEAPHYLIAFKDHTIYSAIAYWVDGDTLHYFTSGNTHNQVSLSLVDRDLTERLNRESGTDLRLPR